MWHSRVQKTRICLFTLVEEGAWRTAIQVVEFILIPYTNTLDELQSRHMHCIPKFLTLVSTPRLAEDLAELMTEVSHTQRPDTGLDDDPEFAVLDLLAPHDCVRRGAKLCGIASRRGLSEEPSEDANLQWQI